ncbi:MAG: CvpA family protein [Deltaproteobacteria bacterium]|nr:CvpA family protein [Deltaproteobacteria bacterium]
MNYIDIFILVVIFALLLKGLWRGLLRELCSVAGLLIGGFLAFRFHGALGQMLVESFRLPLPVAKVSSFLVLFILSVVFFGILGLLLSQLVKMVFLGGLNRLGGALFGLGEGILLVAIALFVVTMIGIPEFLKPGIRNSQLAPPFIELGQISLEKSQKIFSGKG